MTNLQGASQIMTSFAQTFYGCDLKENPYLNTFKVSFTTTLDNILKESHSWGYEFRLITYCQLQLWNNLEALLFIAKNTLQFLHLYLQSMSVVAKIIISCYNNILVAKICHCIFWVDQKIWSIGDNIHSNVSNQLSLCSTSESTFLMVP